MSPRASKKQNQNVAKDNNQKTPDVISSLEKELIQKDAALTALNTRLHQLEDELRRESLIVHRKHPITQVQHVVNDRGKQQMKVGRSGSIATSIVLESIQQNDKLPEELLALKFISVFNNPIDHMNYLQSGKFAHELIKVCDVVKDILEMEPRCLFLQSPVYVFGDIHGNLEDLHFFADNIWKLGIELTAGKFLFLGDYVDRGANGLECLAYLLGVKLLHPRKLHLLRGNHETRDVNGWEAHYREKSFLYQCKDRFGTELGTAVWESVNEVFDRLPLAAVIDYDIFCIHGGIPRPVPEFDASLEAILNVSSVAGISPRYEHEEPWAVQVAADCIWSDPADDGQEAVGLDGDGFGMSHRGGGAACFGSAAIDHFLDSNRLSFVIRAHEAHSQGVSLAKGARVFTVFSTSKDHGQGSGAMAGCVLVDVDAIQVITRSPSYKNRYVHRRSSSIIGVLSDTQVTERRRLGLIRGSMESRHEEVIAEGNEEDDIDAGGEEPCQSRKPDFAVEEETY